MWRPVSKVVFLALVAASCADSTVPQGRSARSAQLPIDHEANQIVPFQIDRENGRVVRQEGDGKLRWSTRLEGYLGGVRPPHVLWDDRQVYVTHRRGVTALDADSGKVLWQSEGPSDRLLLSGELLLATGAVGARAGARDCWLAARSTASGAEVFKVQLPGRNFDAEPLAEVACLFLVQKGEAPGGEGNALLIDRQGQVRHRVGRQVVAGLRRGADLLLLTSTDVVRLSPDDEVKWTLAFGHHQWIAGGGFLELPDGDVLAYRHGYISDSGADVIRLTPSSGAVVWKVHCAPVGVSHSKYRHDVTIAIQGDRISVSSRGSYGDFVEQLDLRSGRQLKRTQSAP